MNPSVSEVFALAQYVEENHDALEADFQRDYGLNLDRVIEEGISCSRIRALIIGLGPGSALHRSQDPKGWSWDQTAELLATIIEILDRQDRHFVMANTKDGKAWDPIRVPRPRSNVPEAKEGTTLKELKDIMASYKKKGDSNDD